MDKETINPKYSIGQVVKFKTTLRSFDRTERIFGKILECYYNEETKQIRYRMDEYPEKSEYTWDIPENLLDSVALMEM